MFSKECIRSAERPYYIYWFILFIKKVINWTRISISGHASQESVLWYHHLERTDLHLSLCIISGYCLVKTFQSLARALIVYFKAQSCVLFAYTIPHRKAHREETLSRPFAITIKHKILEHSFGPSSYTRPQKNRSNQNGVTCANYHRQV
jgi:hypothetical protein